MNRKLTFFSFVSACLLTASASFAQIDAPRPSPGCETTQTVGITDITVEYWRPGMKDRKIFGDLVPFDKMWRTGANGSTKIKFEEAIKISGTKVEAGEYAIYTIPGQNEWSVHLYNDLTLGGNVSGYKKENEVMTFTVKPIKLNDKVETFTINFHTLTDNSAMMRLAWENTAVDIPVEVMTVDNVMTQIKDQLLEPKEPSARTYQAAAVFYMENDKDLDQALVWMNKSVEMAPKAFWYIHQQAKLLKQMGKTKEAIAAAEKSLELAKASEEGDYGYIKRNEELIAELKKK